MTDDERIAASARIAHAFFDWLEKRRVTLLHLPVGVIDTLMRLVCEELGEKPQRPEDERYPPTT